MISIFSLSLFKPLHLVAIYWNRPWLTLSGPQLDFFLKIFLSLLSPVPDNETAVSQLFLASIGKLEAAFWSLSNIIQYLTLKQWAPVCQVAWTHLSDWQIILPFEKYQGFPVFLLKSSQIFRSLKNKKWSMNIQVCGWPQNMSLVIAELQQILSRNSNRIWGWRKLSAILLHSRRDFKKGRKHGEHLLCASCWGLC